MTIDKASAHPALRALLTAAVLCAAPGARANEAVPCDRFVTTVPFTILTPGHYCVIRNLNFAASEGAAITIRSNSVLLDLNGFVLDGSAAGEATAAWGIFVESQRDVTIMNGVVRGFQTGINVATTDTGRDFTVDGMRVESSTEVGIYVKSSPSSGAKGIVIRNNVVTATGRSTIDSPIFGIALFGSGRITNNDVMDTTGAPNITAPMGILMEGGVIIASDNRVSNALWGFRCGTGGIYLKDNVAVETQAPSFGDCVKLGDSNHP